MLEPRPTPETPSAAERLVDVESKLLLLEHDFEALNRAFIERGRELEGMARELTKLAERLDGQSDGEEPRTLEENKPPHY